MYAVKATPTAAMVTIKIGTIESVSPDDVTVGLLVVEVLSELLVVEVLAGLSGT